MACQDEDQDSETQKNLGCRYPIGENYEQNYIKAFEHFKYSADQGNALLLNTI